MVARATPTMEKPQGTKRRVGILAKTACVACRHLKMRCVGAENPPCLRCSKTGRYCVVPTNSQHQQPASTAVRPVRHSPKPAAIPAASISADDLNHTTTQPTAGHHGHHASKPALGRSSTTPAFLSTPTLQSLPSQTRWLSPGSSAGNASPLPAAEYAGAVNGQRHGQRLHGERAEIGNHSHHQASEPAPRLPTDEELSHLSRFFITNLLVQIPVLTEADVGDLAMVVKTKRPLAYSMAYVAARFVPGCKAIRTMLTPIVRAMAMLQFEQFDQFDRTVEDRWMLLQALAVLYSWAAPRFPDLASSAVDIPPELRQDTLRVSIESLALRYSLHKSAHEVADLLQRGGDQIRQSFAFRKYMYWLWLFSVAQLRSLISQTPPSIREDASITQAAQLLEGMVLDAYARRILARVELCLLWVRAGVRERGLGEWWCTIPSPIDLDSTMAVLGDLDAALQAWRRKWCAPDTPSMLHGTGKVGREGALDLDYHFTRFCIGTYAAQVFQSSTSGRSIPLSTVSLVVKTVERASSFCHYFLQLSPLAKSSVRFSPETTFAMVAASCESLIQTHSSSAELDLVQPGHRATVREVAELMIDLGIDEQHSAKVYGHSILAKLAPPTPAEPWPKPPRAAPARPLKRSPGWAASSSESQGAQALLSFTAVPDEVWPVASSLGPRGIANGEPPGLGLSSSEGGALWPVNYYAPEPLVSGGAYWTS